MRVIAVLAASLAPALALALPSPAPAGRVGWLPAGDELLAGPAVAGEAAFVLARRGRRYRALVVSSGDAPRRIGTGAVVADPPDVSGLGDEYGEQDLQAFASPTRAGWLDVNVAGNSRYRLGRVNRDLHAGPLDGAAARLTECGADVQDPTPRTLGGALDGDRLAVVSQDCPGTGLEVRDLGTGEVRALPLAEAPTGAIDAGGGLVAVGLRDRPVVSVRSAATGEVVFEAPGTDTFALDELGRLFVLEGRKCDARLSVSSAASAPQPLPGAWCAGTLDATNGHALVVGRDGDARVLHAAAPDVIPTALARSDDLGEGLLGSGAGGGLVAFALADCAAAAVHVVALTAIGTAAPRGRCPGDISPTPVSLGGGDLNVHLRCPKACLADVRVRAGGRLLGKGRVAGFGRNDEVTLALRRRAKPYIGRRVTVAARFRPRSDLAFGPVRTRSVRAVRAR